jgi:HSP20 family protein
VFLQEKSTMSKDSHSQTTGQSSGQGKQQSSEMAQDRISTQQGGGSAQQGSGQNYQPGSQGSGWQRFPGSALASRRGSAALSPYGGYGGGAFSTMRRITEEMDRLFDSFGRGFFPSEFGQGAQSGYSDPQGAALWAPHVDVVEGDGKLLISADLPGVKKEDVKVEINQDSVTIQGQRHQESTRSDRGYYHSERSYGSFYRAIPLPEGAETESASAAFRDGVLQIEIKAPTQQARGRTLEIKDAGSATAAGSKNGGQQQQR